MSVLANSGALPSPWRHPIRWLATLLTQIHEDLIDQDARRRLDLRPLVMLTVVAVLLAFQEFWGDRGTFRGLGFLPTEIRTGPGWELWSFGWWSGWRVLGYLVVPAIVVLCTPGERLRDYGWSPRGFVRHIGLYLLMLAIVMPLVAFMSETKDFQRIYPFYKRANCSPFDFWTWEALYAAQFLSLEFFFRGFMLFYARRSLGVHAIWIMVVPYCMIHFGKTLIESLAAIIAGLVLGVVALRTRSIWGGIFVHVAVALAMDLFTVDNLRPCKR